jgi:hypothetical protein
MDALSFQGYFQCVRKRHFAVVAAFVLLFGWGAGRVLGLVLAALGLFAAFWLSVILHPRTRHTGFGSCGGTGEHRGVIFGWGHRRCGGCDGGRMIRQGAGMLGTGPVREEYARRRQARRAARDRHAWR